MAVQPAGAAVSLFADPEQDNHEEAGDSIPDQVGWMS